MDTSALLFNRANKIRAECKHYDFEDDDDDESENNALKTFMDKFTATIPNFPSPSPIPSLPRPSPTASQSSSSSQLLDAMSNVQQQGPVQYLQQNATLPLVQLGQQFLQLQQTQTQQQQNVAADNVSFTTAPQPKIITTANSAFIPSNQHQHLVPPSNNYMAQTLPRSLMGGMKNISAGLSTPQYQVTGYSTVQRQ